MDSDAELIAMVVSGNAAAADAFVDRYGRFVLSILSRSLSLSVSDVEEVFQRVWLHLWESDYRRLRQWRGEGDFKSYLAVLVRHLAYDYLRAFPNMRPLDDPFDDPDKAKPFDPAALDPRADEIALAAELRRVAAEALERLRPRDRELIMRRHIQEQSYRQIAQEMDMTVNNVGVALSRAEARLRAVLRERYPDFVTEESEISSEEAETNV